MIHKHRIDFSINRQIHVCRDCGGYIYKEDLKWWNAEYPNSIDHDYKPRITLDLISPIKYSIGERDYQRRKREDQKRIDDLLDSMPKYKDMFCVHEIVPCLCGCIRRQCVSCKQVWPSPHKKELVANA